MIKKKNNKILKNFVKVFLFIAIFNIWFIIPSFSSNNSLFINNTEIHAEWSNDLMSKEFVLDVNSLTPWETKHNSWAKKNIADVLNQIVKFLLITIPTLATMFIVVGALKIILAWWDSTKINNWKTIITYNIIAVCLALLSWSIVQLIIWILWSAA